MSASKEAVSVPEPAKEEEEDRARYSKALAIINASEVSADLMEESIDLLTAVLEYRCGKYGELSVECAPAFYNYGIALFTKARLENDVFGEPVQKAMVEKAIKKFQAQAEEEAKENKDTAAEGAGSAAKAVAAAGDDENVEEVEEQDDDLEEEENDMELAWRNLETARLIYGKQDGHEKELADVYAALAELSMEREDFETSIQDFKSALFVLEKATGAERMLAEIHYKLCLALQLAAKEVSKAHEQNSDSALPVTEAGAIESAVGECRKAHDILSKISSEASAEEKQNLEAIIEELGEKLKELSDTMAQIKRKNEQEQAGQGAGPTTSSQLGFDKPKLKAPVVQMAPVKKKQRT